MHLTIEDVTKAGSEFRIQYQIHAVNGTAMPNNVISKPTIIYVPAAGKDMCPLFCLSVSVFRNFHNELCP